MADNWITPSSDDVLKEFTPAEAVALKAESEAEDYLPDLVTDVIAEFRQAIVDGGGTLNEDTATMPPGFRAKAIALARWRWLIAFPRFRPLQTAERKQAAEQAEALLERIASGERKVAAPDTTEGLPTTAPSFGTRGGTRATDPAEREFTRTNQDGI